MVKFENVLWKLSDSGSKYNNTEYNESNGTSVPWIRYTLFTDPDPYPALFASDFQDANKK